MVWQPTGSQASGLEVEDIRCGTVRSSMTVNPLLTKPALGQVKKTLFNNPPPEKVFGYTPPRDPEGAREVTAIWKEHRSSPAAGEVKPVKDFKTMNKLAVDSGLTTAKELPAFRASHNVMVSPEAPKKSSPKLPSDRDRTFSYGMASAYRTPEVVRTHGPQEPPVKYLVQGAYQDEWVMNNLQREATTQRGRPYIPPAPTKAVMGHSVGAARYLQPHSTEEPFKMAKFKAVESRVTQYMGGRTGASMTGGSGAAHYQQQYQQDQQEQYYHESSEPYSGGEGAQS